jgi:hypothetical protein
MIEIASIPVRGNVSIRVTKDGKLLEERSNHNVIIVDLLRVIMSQLIPKNTSTSVAITSTGRPNIPINETGPDNSFSIAYMKIGYTDDSSIDTGVVSKLDTNINSTAYELLKITKCVPTANSISFYASKSIDLGDSSKFFFEAGLFCPNVANKTIPAVGSVNQSELILVAHQIYDFLQAPSGSTIEFEWTLIFQE